jgi:hypothetical protein
LRKDEDFSDVTLTCDGDTRIEAHRVILAGSSKFFSRILKQQQHPHPLLYMRGMTAGQLSAVVDFIYHGEANIFQEDLDGFLALAEELQLKGLNGTEKNDDDNKQQQDYKPLPTQQIRSSNIPVQKLTGVQSNIWQNMENFQEAERDIKVTSIVPADVYNLEKTQTNNKELFSTTNSMMERNEDGKWACQACGKIIGHKGDMRNHIEANHIEGVSHPCSQCGKKFRSRNSLAHHVGRCRKI